MDRNSRFKALTIVLVLAGASISFVLLKETVRPRPLDVLVLFLVTAAAEHLSVSLPVVGTASLSFVPIFATLILCGGFPAVLVSLASAVTLNEILQKKSAWSVLFNVAQEVLATGAAGLMLQRLQTPPLILGALDHPRVTTFIIGWLLAWAVMGILNPVLVMLGGSYLYDIPFKRLVQEQRFSAYLVNLVILGLLGFLTALVFSRRGWLTAVVLLVPFVLERQALSAYMGLLDSYSDTLKLLVSAIESKDPYTRGHSERVADYALKCARRIGIEPRRAALLERAALLHDIGKIAISSEILESQRELSTSEYEEIRKHPVVGSELIQSVEFLRDAAPIVVAHHERLDGLGYPHGVTGDSIPLESKILACADAYDAMTTDRPYRSALEWREALSEILRQSGTQFDSGVAAAFAEMLSETELSESSE
ncbi:MAG: HD-GYP domain-containing protein [Anaerosomatales bacterium]|nr:HD-GYP domain-containing protein [Anaerosomatales bacterium]MDI6843801.1 HD-GYP domain-containing protein [Anaerosomatales bacterium]